MTVFVVCTFDGSYYQAQTLTNPERILNKSKILRFPEESIPHWISVFPIIPVLFPSALQ